MFRGKTSFLKGIMTAMALLLASVPAGADNRMHNGPANFVIVAPYATQQCVGANISMCGQSIPLPNQALGYSATLSVPSPYVHQPFTVQCTSTGYQIVDASAVTCTLLTCPVSSISLCGASIPVPGGTTIGASVTVPVPVSALADPSSALPNLSLTAQCMDDGNGGTAYQVTNDSSISCNLFPCQDSKVRLCETLIPVAGGMPLGGVLHFTLPPPFAPEPFTIQCVGSQGIQPMYQLTDVSAVTCNTMPQAQ